MSYIYEFLYAENFEMLKRFIFPGEDPRFAKIIKQSRYIAYRITNRDTSVTELRQGFTTHFLRRFRTGTPLLGKFVNNESSCVSTTTRGSIIDGSNEAIKSTSGSTCQFLDAVHVTVVFVMNGSASAPTGVLLLVLMGP